MALVIQNGSLLRSGGALASGSECCCNQGDDSYARCGSECIYRVVNGFLDSEIAACASIDGVELPEGWTAFGLTNCDNSSFLRNAPSLSVSTESCDASPAPVEYVTDNPAFPPFCYDFRQAGLSSNFVGAPFLVPAIGATRGAAWNGYTDVPTEDSPDSIAKNMGFNWDVAVFCAADGDAELCSVCGGRVSAPPSRWYLHAYLQWSIAEVRQSSAGTTTGFRQFTAVIDGLNAPFHVQSCEDMANYTPQPQYDCVERTPSSCTSTPDFYFDAGSVSISTDSGVTIGGNTFPWSTVFADDFFGDFDPDVPSELKEHTDISFYKASSCCCEPESYCDDNPLP